MASDPRDLITQSKLEHWDRQVTFSAKLKELGQRQQDLQKKLQAMEVEANQKLEALRLDMQQKLTVKSAPLKASLDTVTSEIAEWMTEFQQYDNETTAYIKALEKTAGVPDGRDGSS